MSWIARFTAAFAKCPGDCRVYLLFGILFLGLCVTAFGWAGLPVGFFLILVWSRYLTRHYRRYPRLNMAEVGELQLDVRVTFAGMSPRMRAGWLIVSLASLALLAILTAWGLITDYLANPDGGAPPLLPVVRQALILLSCAASSYAAYRNRWRRLLFTDRGLFQIVDPRSPWPTDKDIHEPDSPLRALKIYGWDQVARFHWSRQNGNAALHLNIRQAGISVPQLATYNFLSLSEADQRRLDLLLHQEVAEMTSPAGRGLTAAVAPAPIHSDCPAA
jgi:hypothetical protein